MRISSPSPPLFSSVRTAQMAQTVGQAGSHRSMPTEIAVEAASRVEQELTVRRTSSHTFDIRV